MTEAGSGFSMLQGQRRYFGRDLKIRVEICNNQRPVNIMEMKLNNSPAGDVQTLGYLTSLE